jgi:hypothetical protein
VRITKDIFESRKSLSLWLFKLHNYVTKCQLKSNSIYNNTDVDFRKMTTIYETFRAKCTKSQKTNTNTDTGNGIHHTGGCTQPTKGGIRMRTIIHIKPFHDTKKYKSSIIVT